MIPPLVRCIITDVEYGTAEARDFDEYLYSDIMMVHMAVYRHWSDSFKKFVALQTPIYTKKMIHVPAWYYSKQRTIQVFSTHERRITPWSYRDGEEEQDPHRTLQRLAACMLGFINYKSGKIIRLKSGCTFTAFFLSQQGKLPGVQRFYWPGKGSGGEIFPEPFDVTEPNGQTSLFAAKLYRERQ